MSDSVDHPQHYGGEDNPYEVIKVAEAWGFDKDAYLFNVLKYIARPGKGNYLEDLKKARWYLNRRIGQLEAEAEATGQEPVDYQGPSYGGGSISWSFHSHHADEICGPPCPEWKDAT